MSKRAVGIEQGQSMLDIKGLSKSYRQLSVFRQFSVCFTNRRVCITGENGSGKSTLLCIIAGVITASSGLFTFNKAPLDHRCVAIASDSINMPVFLSPRDVLELSMKSFDCAWPERLIKDLQYEVHIDKKIGELSTGNLKKLQLINALMRDASLLLLDEPNIALDEASMKCLWREIEKFDGMLFIASNEPSIFASRGFELFSLEQGFIK